jgi:peptide/nickel transport system substrate-binding protein
VASSKNSRRLLVLPVLALVAGACGAGRVPDDELVVLIETPPASIDPRYCIQASDFKVSRMVFAPLVSVDTQTLEPKLELAESVTPTVLPSGGVDYEVVLRDARFSDGKPVTTDDVQYTFQTLLDPKTGGAAARIRRSFGDAGLTGIDVRDGRRMTIHLSHPHAPFVTDLNFGLMERPQPGDPPDATPRGAGAFSFKERRGETWIFQANPY